MKTNIAWQLPIMVGLGTATTVLPACGGPPDNFVYQTCQVEDVAVLDAADTSMGFSADQVVAQLASGDWTVSWDPSYDAPFDTLHTTLTLGDSDLRRQRATGPDCYTTTAEDFMSVPVTVDVASGDGSFSATLAGSNYATSLDLDGILVAAQADLVTEVPDSVQSEFDAAVDDQDPSVKYVIAEMYDA